MKTKHDFIIERKLCPHCYDPWILTTRMIEPGETKKGTYSCDKCGKISNVSISRDKYSGEVKVKLTRG